MPQISQIAATYASQAFWLLLVFGFIYFVIARSMLTKVGQTVDARTKKIEDDLVAAERAKAAAQDAEAAYVSSMTAARGNASRISGDAKSKAQAETDSRVKAADADSARLLEAAEQRIGTAKAQALTSVQQVASEAASAILGKLSGASISEADVAAAVQSALRR